ncbi:ComF family protein [Clostridium sp. OM02-18AC]|uniref:ComF family protein n=1 Tax=Clostridium sp. OM02-18AC TaxID=2292311 RepID=UPI0026BFA4EA
MAKKPLVESSANITAKLPLKLSLQENLLQLLFPRRCPVCGQIVLPEGALICAGCVRKLHFIRQPSCKKCGAELISDREEYCPECKRHQRSFESGVALIRYNDAAQKSMAAIKYKNRREYLDFYAEAIVRRYGYFFARHKDAVLVPVPVHPARLRSRGFNQAGELAVRLGRLSGLSVNETMLVRTRKTAPQKELGPEERLRNLRKAFAVREGRSSGLLQKLVIRSSAVRQLSDWHSCTALPATVILVDDIYTTGSTIEACTRVLKEAGVRQVYFVSICIGGGV